MPPKKTNRGGRGTKRRNASPDSQQSHSGRAQKVQKLGPSTLSPAPLDADKDEGAVDASTLFHRTPATKRMASHSSLIDYEHKVYATEMEAQISAEARGVTRKNIPWDTFRSIYLSDFSAENRLMLDVDSVKEIGKGDWDEQLFWNRLCKVLSWKVLGKLELFRAGTKTLSQVDKGKEVPSQPDFVLHNGQKESPAWADVELLFERTRSTQVVTMKFLQWLRGAWSVFHHQPFRRHFYGIMFIKPCAYICYADHGCAVYSEPLNFVENTQHTEYLINFLSGFIADPKCRGRDPTVIEGYDKVYIRHAEETWAELSDRVLCYRPCLIGRNLRVARVEYKGDNFLEPKVVMKSTWEEKLPLESSPPLEVEVLKILLKANVRGLPQPYYLDSAIVRDDSNLEVETRGFPQNTNVALEVSTNDSMVKMQSSFVSNHTSKPLLPSASVVEPLLRHVKVQRQKFNEPLQIRRRLTRIIMSYCVPLKEAMRNASPDQLMRTIRDAMIVYYEAYRLPESGFIHGDISIENILVPRHSSKLTGGLTYKERCGTIIDWNLCFNANGLSSNKAFKSGTAAFMAPILLENKPIARRTLGHDMESFFAVIIWIATLDYEDEATFRAKPLAETLLGKKKTSKDIVYAKKTWFKTQREFREEIIENFEHYYRKDSRFITCVSKLRRILYPSDSDEDDNNSKEMESADPMKENLFQTCMKEIDDYLLDKKGSDEIMWINAQALASQPRSLGQEDEMIDSDIPASKS